MKNIVFSRIDDRLIHGQVMTGWVQYTQASEVVIVDDKVAKDSFMQMVMKSSMPAKIALKILSLADAVEYLKSESDNTSEKIFILAKTPQVYLDLVNAGVEIKTLGIGGMGARAERESFYRNISASKEEVEVLKELASKDIDVFVQVITDDKPIPLKSII